MIKNSTGAAKAATAAEDAGWTVEQALPNAPEAAAVLRRYLAEMISRFHGRETDDAEVDRHLFEGHGSEGLKHGYVEIPRYGEDEFADHWFEKALGDGSASGQGADLSPSPARF